MKKQLTLLAGILFVSILTFTGCSNTKVAGVTDTATNAAEEKNVESNTSEVDTSDWSTYHNDEYGFSFQHPSDWYVVEKESSANVYNEESYQQIKEDVLTSPSMYISMQKKDSEYSLSKEYSGEENYSISEEENVAIVYFDRFNDYSQSKMSYVVFFQPQSGIEITISHTKNHLDLKTVNKITESLSFIF